MKSSLQIKWYGIEKMSNKPTNVAKLPKYILKGTFGAAHYGSVILTPSLKDAQIIKKNCENRKDVTYFEITDKQFGMINISRDKDTTASLAKPFKLGIHAKNGRIDMCIPVTARQLKNNWATNK